MNIFIQGGDFVDELTDIFKILSDETRLRILMLLYKDDFAVCQLSGILELPKVSQALSKMRDLGYVEDNRKEKFVFYSIKKENEFLIKFLELLSNSIEKYPQLLKDFNKAKEKEKYITCSFSEQKE